MRTRYRVRVTDRELLDRIVAAALRAVEPGQAVRQALRLEGAELVVGARRFPLHRLSRVMVVGAGKASAPMAAEAEALLLSTGVSVEGVVIVRDGHGVPTRHVRIIEASHPIPDQRGMDGTDAVLALLARAGAEEGTLVLCMLSGGGSALLTRPAAGLTAEDLQRTTSLLLRSGAPIQDVNAVRKHLDTVKGGGLARAAGGAPLVALVLSDVVGNPLDVIASGPTVPDTSSWADVGRIVEERGLWPTLPPAIAEQIRAGVSGALAETPKPSDPAFTSGRVQTLLVGSNRQACQAAAREAQTLGVASLLLTTFVEGEAREVGRWLAALLREVDASGNPLPRPCCLIAGGETTVTVRGEGLGGRNQEVALGAARDLAGLSRVLLASIGTDGSDGPTDAAGALVDGTTLGRAASRGLDPADFLARNDAYHFFQPLGDLLLTGPTRTNVNDLYVLLAR